MSYNNHRYVNRYFVVEGGWKATTLIRMDKDFVSSRHLYMSDIVN